MGILGYIFLGLYRVMEKKMETTIMGLCGSFPKSGDPNIDPKILSSPL